MYQRSLIYLRLRRLQESEKKLKSYPWLNFSLINSIAFTKQSKSKRLRFLIRYRGEGKFHIRAQSYNFFLPFYIRWEWSFTVSFVYWNANILRIFAHCLSVSLSSTAALEWSHHNPITMKHLMVAPKQIIFSPARSHTANN